MIELLKTQPDGSRTYLIRHTDAEGNDLHKPQRYTIAPSMTEADVEAFAAQVLANHKAGRPLTWREPTSEELLAQAKAKARKRITHEASRLIIERTGPPQRQLAQIVHGQKLSLRAIRGKATPEEEAELDALDALADWTDAIRDEQARLLALIEQSGDPESVTADWPEAP